MIDPEVQAELNKLHQLRQQDLRIIQELQVRLQQYATKTASLADAVAGIVGPVPDTPHMELNTRPRN